MKNYIFLLVLALFASSCEQDFGELNRDNVATVPLTFPNATTFGFDPYIEVSLSGDGEIRYEMEIPETSGRTISEITKVVGGASDINVGTLNSGTSYIDDPIQVAGTSTEFVTSISEFEEKVRTNSEGEVTPVEIDEELAFLFLVTLDNGDQIVSTRVRVRVVE
ncbi:hypothetical protein MM213_04855 [Belliella sp. R4-6]|uniref:DUF4625 domain-containing protein n=1 Tax=Belliella alkalica TaxID=1730871 RepID=A0ABS9V8Q5_9BACT|nr:hypothetical protein [Belliella alkalica]MCH7412805.1 hypothetical protein [Belliella alkalica]